MALNRANVSLAINGNVMDMVTKGTVSLGTSGSYGGSGSTASGPVSIFSNIYKWETYKDPDNNGSGNNGISSKSLLYTMTVKESLSLISTSRPPVSFSTAVSTPLPN